MNHIFQLCIYILLLPLFANATAIHPDVIYGDDDRIDLFQVEDPAVLLMAHATVGLVANRDLRETTDGYRVSTKNFGNSYNLCESEPFREQDTAAFCSGFLVNENTIVTAGHCIRSQTSCDNTSFVFDFAIFEDGKKTPNTFPKNNVYRCKNVVKSFVRGDGADYAIVTLDRSVVNRTPVRLRSQGQVTPGAALTVIGHPAGLPTKVANGASVRRMESGFFVANLDTYGGNSGSAVFNSTTGEVEGILVRGELDFVYKNGCRISNICTDDGCRGEDVTDINSVTPHL